MTLKSISHQNGNTNMNTLIVKGLDKSFGNVKTLSGISFSVNEGEFVSVLGASGSGKTTLLRIIAGLDSCDCGRISYDGIDITATSPSIRNIGMIFQNYSLFPNMTVYQNITYALKCKSLDLLLKKEIIQEVIQECHLESVLAKYPYQLSGGQQQRTAIARALVLSPKVLLLDEPFSALDSLLRLNLRKLIKKFQYLYNITMIYVTHDQEEAFTMSDRILIIRDGIVQQFDTPANIFENPANAYVASFTKEQLIERFENLKRIVMN